jgi:cell division protease FtsH
MPEPDQTDNQNNSDPKPDDGGKGPDRPRGQQPVVPRSNFGWIMLIGLLILLLFLMINMQNGQANPISPQEFVNYAKLKSFQKDRVTIEDERMIGLLKPDTSGMPSEWKEPYRVAADISRETKAYYVEQLDGLVESYESPGGSLLLQLLFTWGPFLLIAFFIYFFFIRGLRGGGGMGMLNNFGRSRHKTMNKEHSTVTLNDVAGVEEAKEEVGEIIEFLKNPKKFQRLGGRVPRGVLLIGAPGCGKTLLAKAVAGEADVPFFSISGSDFVEMFVGVGASRARDLFKQAKDSSPCIIFLDEIDAVGRRRGSGFSSGGHDEREQTLNAILVEMDGFETNDQVIVIAATNRADVLDPALTRPGRFDRQIHVPLPDLAGRVEILKVHGRKVKMGPDVELEKLARGTPMLSGADLAAIINEAAIGATLQNKDYVEMEDLEEARDKVKWGRSRKSHKIEEDERKVIAYHEAGHAVLIWADDDAEPLHKVTIIPRGQALGTAFMLPKRDKHIHTRRQLLAQLRVTFGGRIAEQKFCDDISSGASNDILQASNIARTMVTTFGMSDKIGFLHYGHDEGRNPWEQAETNYGPEVATLIDAEVKAVIDRCYDEAQQVLEQRREQVEAVAEALLKYETLTAAEVDRVMAGEKLDKTTVAALLKAEQEKAAAAAPPPV